MHNKHRIYGRGREEGGGGAGHTFEKGFYFFQWGLYVMLLFERLRYISMCACVVVYV